MPHDESDVAVVLVSHGDRAGSAQNAALLRHAEALRGLALFRTVTAGVLKGEPSFDDALGTAASAGAREIVVYPLFMADGYFMRKVRERVRAAGLVPEPRLLAPLGLDPALPDILVREAVATAKQQGFEPAESRLLIVGHGSKLGPDSATATRKVAARAALACSFASVTAAFLEEDPFLQDALRAGTGPTIVAGFFFGNGMHAGEDVPDAIEETGANAVYTGAIGNSPAVTARIAAALVAEANDRAAQGR